MADVAPVQPQEAAPSDSQRRNAFAERINQAVLGLQELALLYLGERLGLYRALHEATRRWILVCEYYNPSPVTIEYRGHNDRLFKRDFAGEILDAYPDLRLVDYGFAYRRDPAFPQDDITWFLMEKHN